MAYAVGYAQFGALLFALMVIPGLAYLAYRRPRRVFRNPRPGLARGGIPADAAALAASTRHRLRARRRRRRRRGPARHDGLARIPARARRRLDLAPCRDAGRDFAREGGGDGRRSAPRRQRISRGRPLSSPISAATTTAPIRGRPRMSRPAVGLHPYDSWPAGETKQDLIERIDGAARRAAGLRDRLQPADHRQRARQGVRPAQRARDQGLRRRFRRVAPHRQGHHRRAQRRSRASPTSRSISTRRCRRSRSRSTAAATARYGINVADIADLIRTGIGGDAVSQVFIGERHYDMTVRFPTRGAQQPRGDQGSGADIERRRAGAAVAGRATSSCRPAKA